MARVKWNTIGSRMFEAGVDRGVLYVNGLPGVPWNGLISVSENRIGGEAKAYYLDGERVLTRIKPSEFAATLNAYASPEEFDQVDGTVEIYEGLSSTHQPRKPFGLTYRTLIGNDTKQNGFGYKIHILMNVYAEAADRDHQTLSDSTEASSLSWNLVGTPSRVGVNHKPSVHFVVDSTKVSPEVLAEVEEILYGSDSQVAEMPTVEALLGIFASFIVFKLTLLEGERYSVEGSGVTDNGDGSFDMEDPSITDFGDETFSID